MTSFQRAREALGQRLRELRRDANLTGRQLAAACEWVPSKISKIESGRQTPSERDIRSWARACKVPDATADLVSALATLESQYLEVRRKARLGMPRGQRVYAELEFAAARIRSFAPATVPGLLQTPDYARHRLAYWARYRGTEDQLDEAVAARMQRQQALYTSHPKFHFVVTEAVLRYRLCPLDVLEGQLDRLLSVATMRSVHLGVIPFEATYSGPGPMHNFVIYDEERARVETLAAELQIEQPTEIRTYLTVFAEYAELAVYGANARALIARALSEMTATAH